MGFLYIEITDNIENICYPKYEMMASLYYETINNNNSTSSGNYINKIKDREKIKLEVCRYLIIIIIFKLKNYNHYSTKKALVSNFGLSSIISYLNSPLFNMYKKFILKMSLTSRITYTVFFFYEHISNLNHLIKV